MVQVATATVETALRVTSCGRCGEPVITLPASSGGVQTVDARPERGGLYGLDEYGRLVRRGLVVLAQELRGLAKGEGYAAHECLRDTAWFDR